MGYRVDGAVAGGDSVFAHKQRHTFRSRDLPAHELFNFRKVIVARPVRQTRLEAA